MFQLFEKLESYYRLLKLFFKSVQKIFLKEIGYTFNSFDEIQKTLSSMLDQEIVKTYSNMIIGIDEVHNLRQYEERKKEGGKEKSIQYNQIHRLMHLVKGCKKIIMSGTPMTDTIDGIADVMNLILPLDNQMPTLKVTWDSAKINVTNVEMGERMRKGNPSVEVISWEAPNTIRCGMHVLEAGEEKIVASRLREELLKASV